MLSSANGRHRRPRQTPAAVVTVAATGAGIALPLLGTGVAAAHAAEAGTWEKVAICETGGQWDHNAGNGFYGGLDLTQTSWVLYGGLQYANRPDHATRDQQIAVAEKILDTLGPDAWPGCELGTGLLDDGTSAGDDQGDAPGDTATPDPGATATPGTPSTGATDTPAPSTDTPTTPATPTTPPATGTPATPPATATPTDPADPTAPPTAPTTGTPTTPAAPTTPVTPTTPATGSGRHARPYSPTDEALAAADRATRTLTTAVTDGTAATGKGKSTGSDASAGATDDGGNKSGNSDTASHTSPSTYKVGEGDSLSGIAADHDVAGGWRRLYDANQQLIGANPNLIKPGQILKLG